MLLQVRRHDGSTEEIEVLRSAFAREIASAFDWDTERRRFEREEEAGAECYWPSITFTDNAGRMLEFGPNTDDTFWVAYRYSTMKSTFGFCPLDHQHQLGGPSYELIAALDLMEMHYAGKHLEILALLPEEEIAESADDEPESSE